MVKIFNMFVATVAEVINYSCLGKMGLARKPGALKAVNPYLLKDVTSGVWSPAKSFVFRNFSAQLAVSMDPDSIDYPSCTLDSR